jgi:hypothetical protein
MFTKYEFEFAIDKVLQHGQVEEIAARLGMSSAMLGQYFDPNNDRASTLYRAAAILAAWTEIDEEAGRKALDLFCYFVRRSLPGKDLCIDQTREKAFREDVDFKLASVNGDIDTQIKELEESIAADAEHLEALRGEKKRQIHTDVFKRVEARFSGNGVRARR